MNKQLKIKVQRMIDHYNHMISMCDDGLKEDKEERRKDLCIGKIFEIDYLTKDMIRIEAERNLYEGFVNELKIILKNL